MKPEVVHTYPGIYLIAEENPGKPQLGGHLIKAVQTDIATNGIPYLQMTMVGLHSTSGKQREREGRKEWREVQMKTYLDWVIFVKKLQNN